MGPEPSVLHGQAPFDMNLLNSSPPDGTELHTATELLNTTIASTPAVPSPAKRFLSRATQLLEIQNTELTILRKQYAITKELLESRKRRKKGKRVALEGRISLSLPDVLEIARKHEAEVMKKKATKMRKKHAPTPKVDEEDENMLDDDMSESEGSDIIVMGRTSQ